MVLSVDEITTLKEAWFKASKLSPVRNLCLILLESHEELRGSIGRRFYDLTECDKLCDELFMRNRQLALAKAWLEADQTFGLEHEDRQIARETFRDSLKEEII